MRIAVTGYASLDYAVRLDSPAAPDRTATIVSRPRDWPRLGGSPAYVSAALAANGVEAAPVSWIGDDAEGARYLAALRALGVATEGVAIRPGRTPVCVLAYQPDGSCLCLYDPSFARPGELDAAQRALVAEADALCVTVGPAPATRQALAAARGAVIWVVKADPRATPPDLAEALSRRADLIFHSRGEAPFVEAALAQASAAPPLRVETRGGDGVAIFAGGAERVVPVAKLDAEDTTGAGDTFVGGFLAARFGRGEDLVEAAQAGAAAARALLAARIAQAKDA